jgi:hypothetical protein
MNGQVFKSTGEIWRRKDIPAIEVLRAYRKMTARPFGDLRMVDEILALQFPGCPEKVIYSAMSRECGLCRIEYGVSLRRGWLTARGSAALAELEGGL